MKCTDCNGNRFYEGLGHYNEREPCRHCGGSGIEPGGATGGAPLRDYQQQAVDDVLSKRALWTGRAESIPRDTVLRVSRDLGNFPGRVYLELSKDRHHFMDAKYDDGNGYVSFQDADTGVHWVLLGRRKGDNDDDDRWMTWNTVQVPRPVIQDHAQDHYLALYQRIEMKNEFKCIWHY